MILDDLQLARQYERLHPGFPAAFEYLQHAPLNELPLGRHLLDGERLFLLVARDPGRGRPGAKLEAHLWSQPRGMAKIVRSTSLRTRSQRHECNRSRVRRPPRRQ